MAACGYRKIRELSREMKNLPEDEKIWKICSKDDPDAWFGHKTSTGTFLVKLKSKEKAAGISYQRCLQLFMQEEFLRKLSKYGYEDTLILKGGLFIYTLTNFESWPTIEGEWQKQ